MTLCVPFTFLNLNFLTSKIECSISPDRIIVLVLGSFVCLCVFCTVQFPDLNLDLRGLYFKEAFISKSKLSQINTWPASHTEASLFQRSWLILITNHLSCFFFFLSSLALNSCSYVLNLLKKSKSSKSRAPQAQH